MDSVGYIVVFCGLLGLVGFGYYASFFIRSGIYLKAHCQANTSEKRIALTFDDGPDETMTPRVLDVLAKHHIQATFFLIGRQARRYPELVQRIVREGHCIGGHSFGHAPGFPLRASRHIMRELEITRSIVAQQTSLRMRLFHPPFGVTNPLVARAVRQTRLEPVGWSVRAFDTCRWIPRKTVLKHLLRQVRPGSVVLLHDRCPQADHLTDTLIQTLTARGYRFERIDQLFHLQAYES